MKKISLIIPAYNEEANLKELHRQLDLLSRNDITPDPILLTQTGVQVPDMSGFEWEFLFINDGSRDNTLSILREMRRKDPRVNIVNLSRNFGKENALLAGFDYASGDAAVIIDADLQHPLNVIPIMIAYWLEGYDDVYGKRVDRDTDSFLRKAFSNAFYKLLKGSSRIEMLPNVGDFRLIDRRMLNALKELRETQRYTKGLYCWVGYRKKEVPFKVVERLHGESSFNFKGLINLAVEGITSFTTEPLRLSMTAGFVVSFLALAYLVYIIVKTIIWGDPIQGFPTLISVILFMGGVQLISLGIIGEYIGRIFNEAKRRPTYIAESYNEERL